MDASTIPAERSVSPADVQPDDEQLVTALELERTMRIPRVTTYRMVRASLLPYYRLGVGRRGLRFKPAEVLAALRASAT